MSNKENGKNISSSNAFDTKSVIELAKSKLVSGVREQPKDEDRKNQRRLRDLKCKSICVSDVSMGLVSNRKDSWEVTNRRASLRAFSGKETNGDKNGDPAMASKLVSGLRRNTDAGDLGARRNMRDFKSRSFCSADVSAGLVSQRTGVWEVFDNAEGSKKVEKSVNDNNKSLQDEDNDTKTTSKLVAGPRVNGTAEEIQNRRMLRDVKSRSLCGVDVGSGLVSKRTGTWEVLDTQKEKPVSNKMTDTKSLTTDSNGDNNKDYYRRSLIDASNGMFYTGSQTGSKMGSQTGTQVDGDADEKKKKRDERDRRSRSFCSNDVDSGLVAKRKELFGKFQQRKVNKSLVDDTLINNNDTSAFNGVKLREKPPNIDRNRPKSFCYGAKESFSKIEELKTLMNQNNSNNNNRNKRELIPVVIDNIDIDGNQPAETPREVKEAKEVLNTNGASLVNLRTKQLNSFNRDRPKSFCFGAKEGFSKIEHLKNKIKESSETIPEQTTINDFKNEKEIHNDAIVKTEVIPTSEVIMRDKRPNINRNRPKSFCLGTKESILKVAQLNNLVNESKEEFLARIAASPVLMKKDKKLKLPIKKKEKTIKEEVPKNDKVEVPPMPSIITDKNVEIQPESNTKPINDRHKADLKNTKEEKIVQSSSPNSEIEKYPKNDLNRDLKITGKQSETEYSPKDVDFSDFDTETDLCLAMIAEAEGMNKNVGNKKMSVEIKRSSTYKSKQRFPTTDVFYSENNKESKVTTNDDKVSAKDPIDNDKSPVTLQEMLTKDCENLDDKNKSGLNVTSEKTTLDERKSITITGYSANENKALITLRPKLEHIRDDRPKSMDFSMGMRSLLTKDIPTIAFDSNSDLSRIASTEVLERNSKKRLTLKKKKKKVSSAEIVVDGNNDKTEDGIEKSCEQKAEYITLANDVEPTSVINGIPPLSNTSKTNTLSDPPSKSIEKKNIIDGNNDICVEEQNSKKKIESRGIENNSIEHDVGATPIVIVDPPAMNNPIENNPPLDNRPITNTKLENTYENSSPLVKLRPKLKHLRSERPKSMDFSCGLSAKEKMFFTSSRLSNNSSFDDESSESDLSRIALTEVVGTHHKRRLTLRKKKGRTSPLITKSQPKSNTDSSNMKSAKNNADIATVENKSTLESINGGANIETEKITDVAITKPSTKPPASCSTHVPSPSTIRKSKTEPSIANSIPQNGDDFNVVTQKPPKPTKIIRRPKLSRLLSDQRPKTTDFSSLKTLDLNTFSDKSSDIEPIVESDLSRIASTPDVIQRNTSKRLTLKKKKKKSVVSNEEEDKLKTKIEMTNGKDDSTHINESDNQYKCNTTEGISQNKSDTVQGITQDNACNNTSPDDTNQRANKIPLQNKSDNITNTSDNTTCDKVSDKPLFVQDGFNTTKANDNLQNTNRLSNGSQQNGAKIGTNGLKDVEYDISLDKNDDVKTNNSVNNTETNTELNSKRTANERNVPKSLTGLKSPTLKSPTSPRSPSNTPKSPISPTSPNKFNGFTRDRRRHSVKDIKNLFDQNSSVTYRKKERTIMPARPRSMDFSCFLNQDDKKSLSFLSRIDKCRDDLKVTNV